MNIPLLTIIFLALVIAFAFAFLFYAVAWNFRRAANAEARANKAEALLAESVKSIEALQSTISIKAQVIEAAELVCRMVQAGSYEFPLVKIGDRMFLPIWKDGIGFRPVDTETIAQEESEAAPDAEADFFDQHQEIGGEL